MEIKSVVDDIDNEDVDIEKFFELDIDDDSDSDSDSDSEQKLENDPEEDIIIGIDLGTTNSAVCIIKDNNYEIIPDEYGNRTVPSIVSFSNISKYVGYDAKNQLEISPENSYYEVKRLIGKKFDDTGVQNDIPLLTYEIEKDVKNNILLKSSSKKTKKYISPEEISSHILRKLKDMACEYLKKPVKKAVITVPAYFNDSQREATKDAARIAGLECIRIINEPTAAALMYGLHHRTRDISGDTNILVYDLGGGTLDCSVLCISEGIFEVLASTGNTHLGGADFDKAIMRYIISWFKHKYKIDKLNDVPSISVQKLRKACERAKKLLSTKDSTTIAVKDFYQDKNIFFKLDRKTFYKICKDLFILCLKPVEDVLNSANLDRDDIDEIILVGGATRMNQIRDNLSNFFGGKQPNMSVDPDEVVAAGAAVQAHIIQSANDPFSDTVLLLDILPLSLGIETIGGEMTTLIPRNTRIPCRKTKKFTTDDDDQTAVTIKVFEGERKLTQDNFKIAEFDLSGLEPAPRGVAKIDITFSIDVNGIIHMTALDKRNEENKNSCLVKCNKGRLTSADIDKLVEEANNNDMKDKYNRAIKRLRYDIDDLCNNVLTNLKNDEFKLKKNDVEMIILDITKVLEWLKKVDNDDSNEGKIDKKKKNNYEKVVKRLNKRYGTLILKLNNDEENVKAEGSTINATSVYGNEDDENDEEKKVFEEIEDDEFGFTKDEDEEQRKKIKELRLVLTDTCNSVFDILYSGSLNIDKDEICKLKDHIDDTLLWTHVKQKIKIDEYEEKINEINKLCNELVETKSNDLFKDDETFDNNNKGELEKLCYAIKSSINTNMFNLEKGKIEDLSEYIDNCLEYILNKELEREKQVISLTNKMDIYINKVLYIQNLYHDFFNDALKLDYNLTSSELKNLDKEIDEECKLRVDNVNLMCNDLYNSMMSINLNFGKIIDDVDPDNNKDNNKDDNEEILTKKTEGDSIADLIKKQQQQKT